MRAPASRRLAGVMRGGSCTAKIMCNTGDPKAVWMKGWGGNMTEREIKKLLNKVLKELFFKILRIQEKIVSKSANGRLSRTEMHMLEEIESAEVPTLTNIASGLDITKATASVTAARLEAKKYIEKVKSDKDRRMSILKLTEKGRECCENHRQFHDEMVQSLLRDFKISEYPDILKSLNGLADFFSRLEKN